MRRLIFARMLVLFLFSVALTESGYAGAQARFVEYASGTLPQAGVDFITYRVFVYVWDAPGAGPDDWVAARIRADLEGATFYQNEILDDNPPNPVFIPYFPDLEYDTYYTSPADYPSTDYQGGIVRIDASDDTDIRLATDWSDAVDNGNGEFVVAQLTILPASPDWRLDAEVEVATAHSGNEWFACTWLPDGVCYSDCNGNGLPDGWDAWTGSDCNGNEIPDECDLADGTSMDYDLNGVPDECEDCNANGVPDACDLDCATGDCAIHPLGCGSGEDYDLSGTLDECEDCNRNGIPDACDLDCAAGDCASHPLGCGSSTDFDLDGIPDECDPDCNGNGVPDACDIDCATGDCASHPLGCGGSEDCNGNGIPDDCIAWEDDCNENGVPDECDVAGGTSEDCNGNGIPDECDIADGFSLDCNGSGRPDDCDVADATSPDCNDNGVPDECDIANGTSDDCDESGVPDECEIGVFTKRSRTLAPFGTGFSHVFTIPRAPEALGAVTLEFEALGDFGSVREEVLVYLNDVYVARALRGSDGHDCPGTPDSAASTITMSRYNELVAGGDAVFRLVASDEVDPFECDQKSYVIVSITYASSFHDCNNNGVLDVCDIADGTSADFDLNGIPDECDPDCNGNGVPDACDVDCNTGDCGLHPSGCETSDDCNANGTPDECEIGVFVAGSGRLSPIGAGAPQSFSVTRPPEALGDVTLRFEAVGDFAEYDERVDVRINGELVGSAFSAFGAQDCPDTPDRADEVVPMADFNALVAGGDAVITMTASGPVDPDVCHPRSYIAVALSYDALFVDCNGNGVLDECDLADGISTDCNSNGIPDECDLAAHTSDDCNGNEFPDECDIALGSSRDCNENGVPDECEILGDINRDGRVDWVDAWILLGHYGQTDVGFGNGDLNRDGIVNLADLALLLADFGRDIPRGK